MRWFGHRCEEGGFERPRSPAGAGEGGRAGALEAAASGADLGAAGPPATLDAARRERLAAALARCGAGDAIARQLFLAALDYQLRALGERLATGSPAVRTALGCCACAAAARALRPHEARQAQRLCRGFVADLVQSFDACFETETNAATAGPFVAVLETLRETAGLGLACEPVLLVQTLPPAPPAAR